MSPADPGFSRGRKGVSIAVVFVILGMWAGLTFYSLSIFIDELTQKQFSLTFVSFAVTLSAFAGGIGGVVTARLLRRLGLRTILIGGVILGAAFMIWIGHARSPVELALAFTGMGFSFAAVGFVPCTDLLARTFHPSPSRAITIASTGLSFGGAVMPPAAHATIANLGFAGGTTMVAFAFVAVVVIGSLLVKEPPRAARETGSTASIMTDRSAATAPDPDGVVNSPIWRRIVRLRPPRLPRGVVLLMIAFGLLIFSQGSSIMHLLRIAREAGVTDGAILLTVIAIVSVITRFSGMFVLARVRLVRFSLGVVVAQACAQVLYAFASGMPTLVLASVFMGISVGNLIVLTSLFVLAGFDLEVYASVNAVVGLGTTVGSGLGPLFLGGMASLFGSYSIPLIGLAVASLLGGLVLWRTGIDSDPRTETR